VVGEKSEDTGWEKRKMSQNNSDFSVQGKKKESKELAGNFLDPRN